MATVRALQPSGDGGWELRAEADTRGARAALRGIGARRRLGGGWHVTLEDDASLADAILVLGGNDFAFVDAPHGWPPAAVVSLLRERGVLEGPPLVRLGGGRAVRDL